MSESVDYVYIRAWEDWIGISYLTLEASLTLARETHAPENAVFYSSPESRWITFDEITNKVTLMNLKRILNSSYGFDFPKNELIW